MKIYYDLHIHSCLSPCASEEMTPNNIVNMSMIKGLDVIAVTDHNSTLNCESIAKLCEETNLLFIPGTEIQTIEDVHVVCLFPDLGSTRQFQTFIEANRMPIKNKPEKFGDQWIVNERDEIIGDEVFALISSLNVSIEEVVSEVKRLNGAAFPAHVNKKANSIFSNLGFIPEGLAVASLEIFSGPDSKTYIEKYKNKYLLLKNSDAHYIGDISERENYIEADSRNVEAILRIIGGE